MGSVEGAANRGCSEMTAVLSLIRCTMAPRHKGHSLRGIEHSLQQQTWPQDKKITADCLSRHITHSELSPLARMDSCRIRGAEGDG